VEAARITWRPLGRLLVERGLLTDRELEQALAAQQTTGKRLGETIVELGFVSGPDLASALAAQYGLELTTESGFGTGLRSQIQQRHETDRLRRIIHVVPSLDEAPEESHVEPAPEPEPDATANAVLLAQLEEQWAKLAAAEDLVAERDEQLEELRRLLDARISPEVGQNREEPPSSHVLLVQLPGGYELVHREGAPPPLHAELALPDLGERLFRVVGVKRSPLPDDSRPCLFAEPVWELGPSGTVDA
jgi:hypothetical protein